MPQDFRRRNILGITSFPGWGPYKGPRILTQATIDQMTEHGIDTTHKAGDVFRGHDYEQLWYRSRHYLTDGNCQ